MDVARFARQQARLKDRQKALLGSLMLGHGQGHGVPSMHRAIPEPGGCMLPRGCVEPSLPFQVAPPQCPRNPTPT
jgi:hypothetical protein